MTIFEKFTYSFSEADANSLYDLKSPNSIWEGSKPLFIQVLSCLGPIDTPKVSKSMKSKSLK